jgi:hypothetical protein
MSEMTFYWESAVADLVYNSGWGGRKNGANAPFEPIKGRHWYI